jgi:hypothetical protein
MLRQTITADTATANQHLLMGVPHDSCNQQSAVWSYRLRVEYAEADFACGVYVGLEEACRKAALQQAQGKLMVRVLSAQLFES